MHKEMFVVYCQGNRRHMNKSADVIEIFNVKGRDMCKLSRVLYRGNYFTAHLPRRSTAMLDTGKCVFKNSRF
jgi:hypothetical protein